MIANGVWKFLNHKLQWIALVLTVALFFGVQPAFAQSQVTLSGFTSTEGPALTAFNNKLFLSWTGKDQKIYSAASSDGFHFGAAVAIPNNTSIPTAAPATAVFNGKMYLTWTGGSNVINIMSSVDGLNYSSKILIKNPNNGAFETALGTTSLTAFNGRLYLAWAGTDSPHFSINVASSTDGVNFTAPFTFLLDNLYGTPYSVGIAVLGGALYVGITGGPTSTSHQNVYPTNLVKLNVGANGALSVAATFASPNGTSSSGPGLASAGTKLAYSWLQFFQDSSGNTFGLTYLETYSLLTDGSLAINPIQQIGNNSAFGQPAVTFFNSHLYYGWLGIDSARTLNIAQVQ